MTGAYGLRIEGLGEHETLRVEGGEAWPATSVTFRPGGRSDDPTEFGADQAVVQLIDAEVRVDRERRTAVYITEREFSVEELVHPYLAPVATLFARWDRRESLHAGAFVAGDGAWALLAERSAGKSTTLGWLAEHGVPIVADDIVVLSGGDALAGPRCLDMRDDASAHLEAGAPASSPREGGRNRVVLPPLRSEVPLRGVVYLEWGDDVNVERVPTGERIGRLTAQRQGVRIHNDPVAVLDLASLPALVLTRPHGLDGLTRSGQALLDAVSG
jgi:hypothetical protein